MTLGERLQQLRQRNGLSQEEVAQKLFLTRQSVSKWENGQAEPGVENLKALARLYGVTVDALVGTDDALSGPCGGRMLDMAAEPDGHPTAVLSGG